LGQADDGGIPSLALSIGDPVLGEMTQGGRNRTLTHLAGPEHLPRYLVLAALEGGDLLDDPEQCSGFGERQVVSPSVCSTRFSDRH
jgi:hypothetical protein